MKKLTGAMALWLASCGSVAASAEPAAYELTFGADQPLVAHVVARVTLNEQVLRMAAWGHPYLPRGWATFVEELEIKNKEGSSVDFSEAEEGTWGAWNVQAGSGERLHLSYDVHFTHDQYDWNDAGGQDSRPSLTNGALFLVTKALFIYSPGFSPGEESAEVLINKPDDWLVSSPWPASTGNDDSFFVGSWISLVNNALVVGKHHQRTIQDGDMTIVLAVDRELSKSVDLFEQTFRKQLGAYRDLFGGTPETQYLVTIRTANEDDGESFENSFNQVITPGRIAARSIVWANTMGHELFHYFNGNHVLIGLEKSTIEWFGEGFTEYYASLTLLRTGLIDEALWFRKLERYLARYVISTRMWPVDRLSLVDAGQDKHRNWLLIYGGGATMALALDIEIRAATQGARGLDQVMRRLKDQFGAPGSRYTVNDILAAVNHVSGNDFTTFFDTHVNGSEGHLDIVGTLRKAGLNVEQIADEFYLSRSEQPTPLQVEIYRGITMVD